MNILDPASGIYFCNFLVKRIFFHAAYPSTSEMRCWLAVPTFIWLMERDHVGISCIRAAGHWSQTVALFTEYRDRL